MVGSGNPPRGRAGPGIAQMQPGQDRGTIEPRSFFLGR